MPMVLRTQAEVEITSKEMAILFANSLAVDQAIFMNELAREIKTWGNGIFSWQEQCQHMSPMLSDDAKEVITSLHDVVKVWG